MTDTILGLGYGGLLLGAVAVFVGGYARGYSGFGSSAIVMALMSMILPPHEVVPIAVMLEVIAGLGQAPAARKHVDWRMLAFILAGAIVGSLLGTKALLFLDPAPLRIAILAFILAASLILLVLNPAPRRASTPLTVIAGLVSGIINGAAALGGLAMALFLATGNDGAARMRATLIMYLSIIGIFVAALLARDGFYNATTIARIAAAIPFLAAGLWFGGRRFGSTSPESFKRFTLAMLMTLATIGLLRVI